MAKSASEMVQMAFTLMDGGARGAAGRAVDAAIADAEKQGEAKSVVEKVLAESEAENPNDESNKQEQSFDMTEEKLADGKVRIGCSFTIDPETSPFAASGEEAAKEDADNADDVDKNAGQATDSAEGLTPVSDELPLQGFAIAEDAVKKSDVKTTAANCKAENVLTCPYHGPEHMEKELMAFFKKNGIVEVDASVESAGKGKYQVWAICEEDDTENVKKAMTQFMNAAGVNMDKKGVHYNPEDEQTVATFKVDWLDKNAKSNKAMHQTHEPSQMKTQEEEEKSDIGEESPKKLEPVQIKPEPQEGEAVVPKQEEIGGEQVSEAEKKVQSYVDAWGQATYIISKGMTDVGDYEKLKHNLDAVNGEPYVEKAIENGKLNFFDVGLDALQTKLNDMVAAANAGDEKEVEGLKKDIRQYVENELNGMSFVTDNMKNLGYWSAISGYAKKIDELSAVHLNGRVYQFDKLNDEQKSEVKKKLSHAAACAEMGDMAGAKMGVKVAEKTLKSVAMKHDGSATSEVAKAEADAGEKADNETDWCKNALKLPMARLNKYVKDVANGYKIPEATAKSILNGQFAMMKDTDFEDNGEGETQLTPPAFNKFEKAVFAEGAKASEALHEDGMYPVSATQAELGNITEAYNAIKQVAEGEKGYGMVAQSSLNHALGTAYHGTALKMDMDSALSIAEKLYDATELIGKGAYTSAEAKLHQAQQVMHEVFMAHHNKQPMQDAPKKKFDLSYENSSTGLVQQALKGLPNINDVTMVQGYQGGNSMLLYFTNNATSTDNIAKAEQFAKAVNDTFDNVTADVLSSPKDNTVALVSIVDKGLTKEVFNSTHPSATGNTAYDYMISPTESAIASHVGQTICGGCVGDKEHGYTVAAQDPHSFRQNVILAEELNRFLSQAKVSILGDEKNGFLVDVKPLAPKMDDDAETTGSAFAEPSPKTFDFSGTATEVAEAVKKIKSNSYIGNVEAGHSAKSPTDFVYLKQAYNTSAGAAGLVKGEIEQMYPNVHAAVQHLGEGGTGYLTSSLYVKLVPKKNCSVIKPDDKTIDIPQSLYGQVHSVKFDPLTNSLIITTPSKESAYALSDALNEHYSGLHADSKFHSLGGVQVQPVGDGESLANIVAPHYVDFSHLQKPKVKAQQKPSPSDTISVSESPSHTDTVSHASPSGKFGGGKAFLQSSVEKYKSSDPTMADKFAKVLAKLYA